MVAEEEARLGWRCVSKEDVGKEFDVERLGRVFEFDDELVRLEAKSPIKGQVCENGAEL